MVRVRGISGVMKLLFRGLLSFVCVSLLPGISPAQDEMPEPPTGRAERVIRFDAPPSTPATEVAEEAAPAISKPEKTEILDEAEAKRLKGKHLFALQWIDWEKFGTAEVTEEDGVWTIKAEQKSPEKGNTDFVRMEGYITEVEEKQFTFLGKIETQVSHMYEGKPCIREGEFHFLAKDKRQYYRLQQMENPCETGNTLDYIDVFFKRPKG